MGWAHGNDPRGDRESTAATVDPEAWVDRLCGLVGELDEQQRVGYLAGIEAEPAC